MQLKIVGSKGKTEVFSIKDNLVYTAYPGDLLVLVDVKHPAFLSINNQDLLISDQNGNSVLVKGFFTATSTADGGAAISVDESTYTASQIVSSIEYKSSQSDTSSGNDVHPFQLPNLANNGSSEEELSTGIASSTAFASNGNLVNAMIATEQSTVTSSSSSSAITPSPVNNAPIANPDNAVITQNTLQTTGNVLSNDTDPDSGSSLQVIAVDNNPGDVGITIAGSFGNLLLNADGTYIYTPFSSDQSLAAGTSAIDSFNYTISDELGALNSSSLVITINGLNDAPTANPDSGSDVVTSILSVPLTGVLANDSDIDTGTVLTVTSTTPLVSTYGASVTMNADGSYIYDPTAATTLLNIPVDQTLVDTFNYTISDGDGGTATGTVSIIITGVQSVIEGTTGNDVINGTIYADVIVGDPSSPPNGADTINGGNGNDVIYGDTPNTDFLGPVGSYGGPGTHNGAGLDVLYQQYGNWNAVYNYLLDPANAILYDDPSIGNNDYIAGGDADDFIMAEGGDDTILPGTGNDTVYGGNGIDVLSYADSTAAVTVDMINGTATGDDVDIFYNIESVVGSSLNDTFISSNGNDTFNGAAGSDTINYINAANSVTVTLATGTATGQGSDSFSSIESFVGSTLNDIFNASGAAGSQTIDGSSGSDTVDYSSETAAVVVNFNAGTAVGADINTDTLLNIENAIGGSGNDTFVSSAASESFAGGLGTDVLSFAGVGNAVTVNVAAGTSTGQGSDSFSSIESFLGSTLNDVFNASGVAGTQIFDGNSGSSDTINYSTEAVAVTVNLATGTAIGTGIGTDTLSNIENIVGGSANDTLTGDANNNTFVGGLGNDTFTGGGGVDYADYSSAAAAVTVNLTTTTATGGAGTDRLFGIQGVIGSNFNDLFTGDAADNSLFGGSGNDTFFTGIGDDIFDGGLGIDLANYAALTTAVTVNLVTGIANTATHGTDTLSAIENVTTGTGNDMIVASDDANVITAGTGTDTVSYEFSGDAVTANLATGIVTGSGGDTLSSIENIIGSAFSDVLVGSSGNNTFVGGLGADTITGAGGTADAIDYSNAAGAIEANMATGFVTVAGDAIDTINTIEIIIGTSGDDTMISGTGSDTFTAGLGNDVLSYVNSAALITFNVNAGTATGQGSDAFSGVEQFIGSTLNDIFNASAAAAGQTFNGNSGVDTVNYSTDATGVTVDLFSSTNTAIGGAIGTDTLINIENAVGGTGNDTFIGNSSNNAFTGGAGSDWVDYSNVLNGITASLATGTVTGDGTDVLATIENIIATDFNDIIASDNTTNNNTFVGGAGIDTLSYAASTASAITVNLITGTILGRGTDTVSGIENVTGGSVNDTFVGDANSNTFIGGAGTDTVDYSSLSGPVIANMTTGIITISGESNDTLATVEVVIGTSGDDTMISGSGADTFTAGLGNDVLSYVNSAALITFNVNAGTATGQGSDAFSGVEQFIGSTLNDTFNASAAAADQTFNGNSGVDTVNYSTDATGVTVDLFSSTNTAIGSSIGTDTLISIENAVGGTGNDTFIGNSSNNAFTGGAGSDWVDYSNVLNGITASLATGTVTGDGTDVLATIENIVATDFNDIIASDNTTNNNTFVGGAGIDTLSYAASIANAITVNLTTGTILGRGTDTVSGIENVTGGSLNDTFVGDANSNTFTGGAGTADTVNYSSLTGPIIANMTTGIVTITGESNDTLNTIEVVIGTSGDDTMISGSGADTFTAGLGNDVMSFANSASLINVNVAAGTAVGQGSDAFSGVEKFIATTLADVFNASGAAGEQTFDGNNGTDTVNYSTDATGVIVDLFNGTATGSAIGTDTLISIENATGGTGNDTLVSSAGNNVLIGGAGSDWADYSNAASGITVNMATGAVTGDGADTLSAIENIIGSGFNDTINSDNTTANNTFTGGAGSDTVSYAVSTTAAITVNLTTGTILGRGTDIVSGIENITGGSQNDTFVGDTNSNTFIGGVGAADTVDYSSLTGPIVANMTTGIVTITGESNDTLATVEVVIGTSGNDTMISGAGADTFTAGLGADLLSYSNSAALITFNINAGTATGQGSDSFSGVESFIGSTLNDIFNASAAAADQTFDGNNGTDIVSYATDATGVTVDLFNGTAVGSAIGTDTLLNIENATGGSGNDTFVSSSVNNIFTGGVGSDWVDYSNAVNGITASFVTNLITGDGSDTIATIENIIGSSFNDTFANANTTANNTFIGGAGNDTLTYAASTATAITVNLATGTILGRGTDIVSGIENVTGGSVNDTFIGDANSNTFIGGVGAADKVDYSSASGAITADMSTGIVTIAGEANDTINTIEVVVGTSGNDTVISGAGADTFTAGLGTDLLSFVNSTAIITVNVSAGTATGQGSDSFTSVESFIGSTLNDIFNASAAAGNQTFDGNSGIDLVSYASDATGVTVDLFNGTATGSAIGADTLINIENATGGTGADTFVSNTANNTFTGGTGIDVVSYANAINGVTISLFSNTATGDGNDTLATIENVLGSNYNDTIISDNTTGNNTYNGGGGIDLLSYANVAVAMTVHLDTGTITGRGTDIVSDIENVTGGSGADQFFGDGNDNVFAGGLGNDTYTGGTGIDTASYAGGAAVTANLSAGAGTSTGQGSDVFNSGIERLVGSSNNDTFTGGTGDQTFAGGLGNDTLIGGGGNDTADYSLSATAVTVDLAAGTATGEGNDTLTTMENIIGSDQGDSLVGSSADNTINGGQGNDFIAGGGGADFLHGNEGDDILRFENNLTSFAGDSGNDTLQLSGGLSLDLTSLPDSQFTGLENIDMGTDASANTLTLALGDVLSLSDTTDTLFVDGNSSDHVVTTDTWAAGGTEAHGANTYQVYTSGAATMLIDIDINQAGILL